MVRPRSPADAVQEAQTPRVVPETRPEQRKTEHDRSAVFSPGTPAPSSSALPAQPDEGRVIGFDCSRDPFGAKKPMTVRPTGELRANVSQTARIPPERARRDRAAETLYRLGLLQADPTSGIRDYRAARATFTQLLNDYPRSPWEDEARAWQATLTDLLVREDEARRARLRLKPYEEANKRTKTNLEWLKQTDTEMERRAR